MADDNDENDDKRYAPLIHDQESDAGPSDEFSCPRCRHASRGQSWRSSTGLKIIIAHLVTSAIITGFSIMAFGVIYQNENRSRHTEQGTINLNLPTDALFGDIPWRRVIMDKDPNYHDPTLDGAANGNNTVLWSDILPTTMIAVPDPSVFGLSGGGKIWENPEDFDAKTEAWTVSVMHQLHCLAGFKNHFNQFTEYSILSEGDYAHLTHCVEILRRNVMCKAELALERPDDPNIWPVQHVSGWGNAHICRDWNQVMSAIKKYAITRGKNGWRRIQPGDPALIL